MNTTDLVHPPASESLPPYAEQPRQLPPSRYELESPVRRAIFLARNLLEGQQRLDGSWVGRKSADVSQHAQFVLLQTFLDTESENSCDVELAARSIFDAQQADGGWSKFPGGSSDLNVTVLAYFALKIVGESPSCPKMGLARELIRRRGGADVADEGVRTWLAVLGQIDYKHLADVHGSIATLLGQRDNVARDVVWTLKPQRMIEGNRGVRELFVEHPEKWRRLPAKRSRLWRCCDRWGIAPLEQWALGRLQLQLLDEVRSTGDSPDFVDLIWQRLALSASGLQATDPDVTGCDSRLRQHLDIGDVADNDVTASGPQTADTALAIEALYQSGLGLEQRSVIAGLRWLAERRLQGVGAWRELGEIAALFRALSIVRGEHMAVRALPPGIQLRESPARSAGRLIKPNAARTLLDRAVARFSSEFMVQQKSDGGWAFAQSDASHAHGLLHAASRRTIAASDAELTGAMLETLARGDNVPRHVIERGVACLRNSQRGDGSWRSSTGTALLHGTTWAVRGLAAAGVASDDPAIVAGTNWLLAHQQTCGGWGESTCSIDEQLFVPSDATALQTAWVVLALVSAGLADHEVTRRGIEFLVDNQDPEGPWYDTIPTVRDSSTGGWYANDLHSVAVPLVALSRWAVATASQPLESSAYLRLFAADDALRLRQL